MKVLTRFELFELVRDATTLTGAQALLLYHIAWRVNPQKNYMCFPSYERLVADTHYTEQMLRRAAKGLEKAGLIRRIKRFKRSTLWYLNVRELTELVKGAKKNDNVEIRGREFDPFDTAEFAAQNEYEADPDDEMNNTDGLTDDLGLRVWNSVDEVAATIMDIWDAHPSVTEPRNREFLLRDIAECVRLAGGPQRCGELIDHLTANDEPACWKVAQSRTLGRYLVSVFPHWLDEYEAVLPPITNEIEVPHGMSNQAGAHAGRSRE